MSSSPLFSICIPTFNRRELLLGAIDSALSQTYANIEVIVSDNASNDGTREAVQALNDPRIRYYRNTANLGPARNFIECLSRANGEYSSWLQDDDLLLDDFVSTAVDVLESGNALCCIAACFETSRPENLSTARVFTTGLSLNWAKRIPRRLPLSLVLPLSVVESPGIPPVMAFRHAWIAGLVSQVCESKFPLYAERLPLIFAAAEQGLFVIPRVCGFYRSHAGQYSVEMLASDEIASKQYQCFMQFLEDYRILNDIAFDDFAEFISTAPDAILDPYLKSVRRFSSDTGTYASVRRILEDAWIARYPLPPPPRVIDRVWRLVGDLTPPVLSRLLDEPIQGLKRILGVK